ncbi:UNVERIFIED_ORG: hypothetical protein FHW05_001834 [Pantoea agglomerans]
MSFFYYLLINIHITNFTHDNKLGRYNNLSLMTLIALYFLIKDSVFPF